MAIIDKPLDYFNTVLYTGDGSSSRSITGVDFQPDWTWVKSRNSADYNNMVTDVVRGTPKMLKTDETTAEAEYSAGGIGSFDSDGFTIAAGSSNNTNMNNNGTTYVGWNWKAGTSFTNDASATGIGTIDSTGSFNNNSGFSIVSYTGTGSAGSIKHGMNIAPKMVIVKSRSGTGEWITWHTGINIQAKLSLNTSDALYNPSNSSYWNSTLPTSSVFSVGTSGSLNGNGVTYIAYCFADTSMSKMGSYTGNGNADGTFVYTGFKPAFLLVKKSSASGSDWNLHNNKSPGFNVNNSYLAPNEPAAEVTGNTYQIFDLLSNGFKCRGAGTGSNASGETMIYMAFAENPFVTSTGVPATAR